MVQYKRTTILFVAIGLLCMILFSGCSNEVVSTPDQPATLWILTEMSTGMNAQTDAVIAMFEETNQNVHIDLEILPTEAEERAVRLERLRTEIMSGKGPDGYLLPTDYRAMDSLFSDVTQSMYNGAFSDITSFLGNEEKSFLFGVNQSVMEAGAINGKQYVLPLRYDLPVVYADSDALRMYGVDLEGSRLTISDLMELVCKAESDLIAACSNPSTHNILGLFNPTYNYESGTFELDENVIANYLESYNMVISRSQNVVIPSSGSISKFISNGEALGAEAPLKISTLSRLMDYTAIAKTQQTKLQVLPLCSANGDLVANITYYAAVGASCEHPELVYNFLREFLNEENQWEHNRKSTEFPGLVEEGWPVRDQGAAENLWRVYRLQHRNIYDDEEMQSERKQAILALELNANDFGFTNAQIDQARFPSRNESVYFRESLIQVTNPTFAGNYQASAEELIQKFQRAFAEG